MTSKRARIFERLLKDINTGNYAIDGDITIFGAESLWDAIDESEHTDSDSDSAWREVSDFLKSVVSDGYTHKGGTTLNRRTTLNKAHPFKVKGVESLTPSAQAKLRELVKTDKQTNEIQNPQHDEIKGDEIDAALTKEMLGKLHNAVSRASLLDELEFGPDDVPDPLKRYFEEAHRCYLYGFKIACAVICRAILEDAFKTICDPNGSIERKLREKNQNSYFNELVRISVQRGLLHDDRPECATDIRKAGGFAIHNYRRFQKDWEPKLDEILMNTRKVLIDLYVHHR